MQPLTNIYQQLGLTPQPETAPMQQQRGCAPMACRRSHATPSTDNNAALEPSTMGDIDNCGRAGCVHSEVGAFRATRPVHHATMWPPATRLPKRAAIDCVDSQLACSWTQSQASIPHPIVQQHGCTLTAPAVAAGPSRHSSCASPLLLICIKCV